MPSLIAWLDASADEQRRMREIIRLFSDRESRDELGIGQIRDAIGDGLFPGTSTLLTRARYLLFVPWCLRMAAQKPDPQKEADRYERALIGAIKATDDYAGLLGMRAGIALKNLPSVIYWTMLRHYGILVDPTMSRADALRLPQLARTVDDIEGDSATRFHVWSPSIPDPTAGFPWEAEGGFALTAPEAGWLRERILDGAPNTLMSHLLAEAPASDSPAPWLDEAALSVPGSACGLLDHARAFSAVLHGAQLLYNLLIAEEYEDAGFDRLAYPVAGYRERLDQWSASLPAHVDIDTWDLDELIRLVELQRGSPINYGTRQFVQQWTRIVRARSTTNLADDTDARACVARRERQHKGAQARIGNRARLAGWGGESGAGALVYRWPQVRGVLTDIHEGLAR